MSCCTVAENMLLLILAVDNAKCRRPADLLQSPNGANREARCYLQATEVFYNDDMWRTHMETFQELSQITMGLRCCGAAAVNLCHVAQGSVDAYWQYMLKPWDVAAGEI